LRDILRSIGLLLLGAMGLCTPLCAQQNTDFEPQAMEALNTMGIYLRSLKVFQVSSVVTSEIVLTNGMKVQKGQKVTLLARAPDRLWAQIEDDNGSRFYFFDGKTFTLFDRDDGYYATVPAPATVALLVHALEDKYGVDFPLADLFLWGQNPSPPKITAAIDLGPSTVDGATCEQYAFRQEGLDWQVWLQLGDYPLPRKLVLTTTTDEAHPQHTKTISWNLAPSYNDSTFTFEPPPGVHKIMFAEQK
jgi:hypothetical protein